VTPHVLRLAEFSAEAPKVCVKKCLQFCVRFGFLAVSNEVCRQMAKCIRKEETTFSDTFATSKTQHHQHPGVLNLPNHQSIGRLPVLIFAWSHQTCQPYQYWTDLVHERPQQRDTKSTSRRESFRVQVRQVPVVPDNGGWVSVVRKKAPLQKLGWSFDFEESLH
jgi:hypothetical protein